MNSPLHTMHIRPRLPFHPHIFSRLACSACVICTLVLPGCSSLSDNTARTLEKQIELQQVRYELAASPSRSEKRTASEFEGLGDTCLRRGDINRAYLYYLKGLNEEPDRISLLQKQGRLLIKKRKYAEAEQMYSRLMPLAGDDPQALAGQGMVYFAQGKYEEAERIFQAALAKRDDDWQVHEYLGLIHSRNQEYDQAITRFKTALTYRPKDVSIINNLAVTCYLNGDFAETAHLLEGLAVATKDRRVYNNLALAHFHMGNYDRALECFKKGSESEAAAYNNIGLEYLYAKKYELAIGAFDRAIALNPRYYAEAQKNLDRAQRHLSDALAKAEQ